MILIRARFASAAVELSIKDLFPGAEIQTSPGYGHNHFASHYLPLHVRVRVVFTVIVAVLADRFMRCELFEPDIVIVMQPGLVIIYEDAGCDVHGVDQNEPFADSALLQRFLHLGGDVDESAS